MASADNSPRKAPTFGPEIATELTGRSWSWWDLWCCAVASLDHGGELDSLCDDVAERIDDLHDGRFAESLLSHLIDLNERLTGAGLSVTDLATPERLAERRFVSRARNKVAGRNRDWRALTPAMIDTPRVLLGRRARFGSWDRWPVSPSTYYERLGGGQRTGVSKGQSFEACRRLEARHQSLDTRSRTPAERLALHRAFHVVAWELQERGDDSYGRIGELRSEAWRNYVTLDPAATGMDPADWWDDLAEMVVWEDYGLTYRIETLHWTRLPTVLADHVDDTLMRLADELAAVHLHFTDREAVEQAAWLAVAHRRWHRFEPLARRLGPDGWPAVEQLAKTALARGRTDLAEATFAAADRAGVLRSNLHRAAERTLGRPWMPRLTAVHDL